MGSEPKIKDKREDTFVDMNDPRMKLSIIEHQISELTSRFDDFIRRYDRP
jgi:hypothetical protein